MEKLFYHYQDSNAMTRSILEWLAAPDAESCTTLRLAANCGLSEEASAALVRSPLSQTIEAIELTEIYLSPAQLAQILTLPALSALHISGGISYDWNGPEYVYPTLDREHIEVLETSIHAQKLRVLSLPQQSLGEETEKALRQTLPHLASLSL